MNFLAYENNCAIFKKQYVFYKNIKLIQKLYYEKIILKLKYIYIKILIISVLMLILILAIK